MQGIIQKIESQFKKPATVQVKSGDTVKVHQKIIEGGKERIQIFEGMVIRVKRPNSLTYSITVRKITSGIGAEKVFMIHSPKIAKIEVTKRSKVRRNNLSYMRNRSGKSARLVAQDFDRRAVNNIETVSSKTEKSTEDTTIAQAEANTES